MDNKKASKLAVRNVLKEGLTDVFPCPFEVDLLNNPAIAEEISQAVVTRIKSNSMEGLKVHSIQHVLYPKKEFFDFRRIALMQPFDTITYLALVLSIADDLEFHRPLPSKKRVFSYRFKPKNGLLFNQKYSYASFDQHVKKKIKQKSINVLVKCDLANFFDRLNLHRLESVLLSLEIDESKVSIINELLSFWASRDSYGIPVGGNASRILAEAALIPVDDYLLSHKIDFCRYVDDYRFFAPDLQSAHTWLAMFVERLSLEGLSINPAKTSLEDVSNYTSTNVPLHPKERETVSGNQNKPPVRLIAGYGGTIPTKFRALSERELNELKKVYFPELIEDLERKNILFPEDVRRFLKVLVAQGSYEKLKILPKVLERFPQFMPLACDLLSKKEKEIPLNTRVFLKDFFSKKLKAAEITPEYVLIAIVRLLGTPGYANKEALLELFRGLKRNAGSYIGRCLIESLQILVTRNDVVELRQYFDRADDWEKRALIRLVSEALPSEEKKAWLRNVKIHSRDDPFAIGIFHEKKKKKKKTKKDKSKKL